jgi:endonuclease/exonuclease/phosphatase family metal-dependent hydrolase
MKIATWNLERPKQPKTFSRKNELILEKLKEINADILILTETNSCINPGDDFIGFRSEELVPCKECEYTTGENRATVWVKRTHSATKVEVSNAFTSACVSVNTEQGELIVYGTVVGILGHPSQNVDDQIDDWRRISESGSKGVCIAGDFNVQFNRLDNFTKTSKDKILACFLELGITNLTCGIAENIDHIAISNRFLESALHSETYIWNQEKKLHVPQLSDHIGVSVRLKLS